MAATGSQTLSAVVRAYGEQLPRVRAAVNGGPMDAGYVAVTVGTTLTYCYDLLAVGSFAMAWAEAMTRPTQWLAASTDELPQSTGCQLTQFRFQPLVHNALGVAHDAPSPAGRWLVHPACRSPAASCCSARPQEWPVERSAMRWLPPDRPGLPRCRRRRPAASTTWWSWSWRTGRSNMLGWVPHSDGRQAGLHYRDDNGRSHATHHLVTSHGCGYGDPGHSHSAGLVQLNHGRCDGFRRRGNDDLAIGYYTRDDLPFYGAFVDQATVFDRWFAAVLGPTLPNRNYTHAGRTDRMANETQLATMPTLWDRLSAAGVPATYYFNDSPYLALWGDRYVRSAQRFDQFLLDAASGTLPAFSYVDPAFGSDPLLGSNDDHPHCDIRRGQSFLAGIAQALVLSPLWPRTALFVTYDEWGGFFDHVRPPLRDDEGPLRGMDRRQSGFRVPSFLLSPYARRGGVDHGVYDHAAIVKFVSWRFGLQPLARRDRSARNLAYAFDFQRPDFSIPMLPVVPDPGPHTCDGLDLSDGQAEAPFWQILEEHAQRGGWRHV